MFLSFALIDVSIHGLNQKSPQRMLGRYGRSVLDSLCLLEVRIICQRSYQRLQTRKTCFFFLRMVSCRKTKYPGVVQLIERAVWERETRGFSRTTRLAEKAVDFCRRSFAILYP